jgi:1-acyl-sn-glycerol-3-phosphate acyltransferase
VNRLALEIRSGTLWTASVLHFVPSAIGLALASRLFPDHPPERAIKAFCRNVVRLAGARLEVRASPGFDPAATCVFVANHVNVFDPFTMGAAIPQPMRGFELASHFDVPVYGWLMRSLGNIPVPDHPTRETLGDLRRRTAEDLARGRSLLLFAEGTRTRTGQVGPFRRGALRVATECGAPIVPVSQVGAFALQHPGRTRLEPARVVVHLHEPIVTAGMSADARARLPGVVRDIVRAPVEEASR